MVRASAAGMASARVLEVAHGERGALRPRRRARSPRRRRASWSRRGRCRGGSPDTRRKFILPVARRARRWRRAASPALDRERVEERARWRPRSRAAPARRASMAVSRCTRARDAREPLRAVVDRVHRGHHREQHLRGADVGGRLLAADVLLAGLQREAQRGLALRVDRDAHQAPRHRALERVARREVARVRAAEAHRHAEALRGADRDVGAELARGLQQREGEQVGGRDQQRAARVELDSERRVIPHIAVDAGVLNERTRSSRSPRARRRPPRAPRCRAARRACAPRRSSAAARRRRPRRRARPTCVARWQSVIASAAAVASSSIEALAMASAGEVGHHRSGN